MEQVANVIGFWCEIMGPDRWFGADVALDEEMQRRFAQLWRKARVGTLDEWRDTPQSALALIVLLDQMPRHMFRGTVDAWVADAQALEVARHAVVQGYDLEMTGALRQFFYFPFIHAEDPDAQSYGVALFETRMPEGAVLDARLRQAVIAQFGRFPWRNEIVGRRSTEAEARFLWNGGLDLLRRSEEITDRPLQEAILLGDRL
ncbi:DUF924 family protein [Thioclava sp. GXIMD4215]|uniref:DUF924 family protein n=1 Tax=Thioclava sp. GXIMD4215 TaxID=3131928 RepID=UPI00324D8A08